jgi:hypothetical protein
MLPRVTLAHGEASATAMADVATRFLASLNDEASPQAVFEFDDNRRQAWHYFPKRASRAGLPLNALDTEQQSMVMELLAILLTVEGFEEQERLRLIHGLKQDLAAPDNPRHLYYTAIFGKPSTSATWGWRYEGHHLSLNCTLVQGKHFSVTPSFWGAGPVKIGQGEHQGLEVFKLERQLSLDLVASLSPQQRQRAKLDRRKGPGASPAISQASYSPQAGIPFAALTRSQQTLLVQLVRAFAGKHRTDILKQLAARKPLEDLDNMSFAYAADSEHYIRHFRIQTQHYLLEFDNPGDNHVHAAWRDFDGDFGRDLIAEHLAEHAHSPAASPVLPPPATKGPIWSTPLATLSLSSEQRLQLRTAQREFEAALGDILTANQMSKLQAGR